MSRPRLLDLFCCAGGSGMGYHRAGFEVVGVDIEPQPHHWDQSSVVQFDALRVLAENPEFIRTFDAIHASPPCQASTALTKGTNKATRSHLHVDLIGQVRDLLDATGLPYEAWAALIRRQQAGIVSDCKRKHQTEAGQ